MASNDQIKDIDHLISNFQLNEARQHLKAVDVELVAPDQRFQYAALARRCGELRLALKFLHNQIFGAYRPSDDELIEYASSVRRLGLINQALLQLQRVQDSQRVHLHKAFCYIHRWDYKKAQQELQICLSGADLDDKTRLVARVNLLTCFVEANNLDAAMDLLNDLQTECQKQSPHLYLNCLETRGQIFYKQGKVDQAIDVLSQAFEQVTDQQGQTRLFIEKWLLVCRLAKGELVEISPEIIDFKKAVRQQGHWEALRDFNWQVAKISENESKMKHIYFGTPYKSFRNSMEGDCPDYSWPTDYMMMDSRSTDEILQVFDFYDFNHIPFAYGKNLHRLMMLLCSDFFQPWSVPRIFNSLFPEDIYDPHSSPKRIYRLLEKLAVEIKKSHIQLDLHSTSHGYRLRPLPGCFFKIHKKMVFESREDFFNAVLNVSALPSQFRLEDAEKVIPLSRHQWYRTLKTMEQQGHLLKVSDAQSLYSIKKVS